jgi:transcriptional regulator with XRE-family HTH domain
MESTKIRELRTRIGRAVRTLRKEERISASYLAKVLGVSQSTVSRIESGVLSLPAEKLCFLAQSFNRPLSFFVGEQSTTTYSNEDILRAGLVQYGASQLKAKRTIDVHEHYRTYEEFLNAALYEVDDPRFAASLATTVYRQAADNAINPIRVVAGLQHIELARYLLAILSFLRKALPRVKRPSLERKRVERFIYKLKDAIDRKYKTTQATHFSLKSSNEVSLFINESFRHG